MIRKAVVVVLALLCVSCGAIKECYIFDSAFYVVGRIVDGRTGEPMNDVFLVIRVIGEDGQLGRVATGITNETGEISSVPHREPDAPPSNRVAIETAEGCLLFFDTWPFVLVLSEPNLGPLPDPSRIILTMDPDGAANEITVDFEVSGVWTIEPRRLFKVTAIALLLISVIVTALVTRASPDLVNALAKLVELW